MLQKTSNTDLLKNIKHLLEEARNKVLQTVNHTMVSTYFEIGRLIVEGEQQGNYKAEYGAETLKNLSSELTKDFGKGFSIRGLERMRLFYNTWSKSSTLLSKLDKIDKTFNLSLSWSHYVRLMSLKNSIEREFSLN